MLSFEIHMIKLINAPEYQKWKLIITTLLGKAVSRRFGDKMPKNQLNAKMLVGSKKSNCLKALHNIV